MSSTDVVVIGAGAVGCATAYFLTRRGVKPIVLEKDSIGSHASGFAFGGLTPFTLSDRPGPEYPLAKEAMRLHAELAAALKDDAGIDTSFERLSFGALAEDDAERAALTSCFPWLRAEGYGPEWLDVDALRRIDPRFAPDFAGAIRATGSAMVEAYRYTLALGQAAEKGGAEVRNGQVTGLRIDGGRVRGVETRAGPIACDQVVVAAGPWTGPASEWLGVEVPVRPLKGQIVRLQLQGGRLEGRFSWHGQYFATKPDGMVWAGTTEEAVGFDESTTTEARDEILLPLGRFFPALLDAGIVQQTACLRPYSGDGLPIIGRAPVADGVWIATGGGRRGILFSSVMGQIAADLVVSGRSELDFSPFALERFAGSAAKG